MKSCLSAHLSSCFPRLRPGSGGGSGLRGSQSHSSAQHHCPGLQRPRPTVPIHPGPSTDPRGRVLRGKSRSRSHHRAHGRRPRPQRRGHPVPLLPSPTLQIQRGEANREDCGNVVQPVLCQNSETLCCRTGRCWPSAVWIGRAGKPTSWWLRPRTKAALRER